MTSIRRTHSASSNTSSADSDTRSHKRRKSEHHEIPERHLTPESFKNGMFLAPMVRSGALPTRLFALKHGATLVWGPEIVDKAILHSTRIVDPISGTVHYTGSSGPSKPIFSCHPLEKPYLIYQIGSSTPSLAVEAAKKVMDDVSGIDLNCGCPKPFSTHAGMGAALLTNPDVLCEILTELRKAMPPHITVSCKIRLLPDRQDTLKLVERIVNTGISALTVHCRTRNMREKDPAKLDRLRDVVDFVRGMGKGIAVIHNGDCKGAFDVPRVLEETGASSVMVARAAEANPSSFSHTPLVDIEDSLIPAYLRLARYVQNPWSLTKFCTAAFKGWHDENNKKYQTQIRERIVAAKGYDSEDLAKISGPWTGEKDLQEIQDVLEGRETWREQQIAEMSALSRGQAPATLPVKPFEFETTEPTVEPPTIVHAPIPVAVM